MLIWGAISWCTAIATPAMYFPGMSFSGVAFGFIVAADVIIRYPFFVIHVSGDVCFLNYCYVYLVLCELLGDVLLYLIRDEVVWI